MFYLFLLVSICRVLESVNTQCELCFALTRPGGVAPSPPCSIITPIIKRHFTRCFSDLATERTSSDWIAYGGKRPNLYDGGRNKTTHASTLAIEPLNATL